MKRISNKTNKTIFFIIFLSFLFSVIGVWYGLPMHLVGDEESIIGGAMKMIETRNPIPTLSPSDFDFLYYPVLLPYMVIIFSLPYIFFKFIFFGFNIQMLQDFFAMNQQGIWISARILSAVFGALLVYITYRLSLFLFSSKRAAYFASVFLTFSFLHLVLSHFVRHWIYAVFFIYLIIYLTLFAVKYQRKKYFYLLGLISALAVNVSYITIVGIMTALFIVAVNFKKLDKEFVKKAFFVNTVVFVFLGGFLLSFNIPEIIKILGPDSSLDKTKSITGLVVMYKDILKTLFNVEIVLLILTVFSLVFRNLRRWFGYFLAAILGYGFLLYFLFHFEIRYVFPLVPLMAVISGVVLEKITESLGKRIRVLSFAVIFIVFLFPVLVGLKYVYLLSVPDTRQQALDWIKQNIKQDVFLMNSESLILPRSREYLEKEKGYGRIRAAERYYLSQAKYDFYNKRYNYFNLHFWNKDNNIDINEFLKKENIRYYIIDYWDKDEITDIDRSIIQKSRLVREFSQSEAGESIDLNGNFDKFISAVFGLKRLGPKVDIYEIEY